MTTALDDLGWTEALDASFRERAVHGAFPARVSAMHQGACDALAAEGAFRLPIPPSRQGLAVGDWVVLGPGDLPRLLARLPRGSALTRQAAGRATAPQVLAANVDLALLVTAIGEDFSPRRLERYLAVAHAGGVRPAIVLNKLDRDPSGIGRWLRQAEDVAPDTPVVAATTLWAGGLDDLEPLLARGRTVVLLGSSGVGKSSIVNMLLGEEAVAVAPIRERDDTGRHTTSHRQLHQLGDRGLLIDTPGLRELGLWDTAGLDAAFSDLVALAEGCRFRDCTHGDEPECAVVEAVQAGRLDADRLESWRQLRREAAAREMLRDPSAQKAAGRRMAKMIKEVAEERRRRGR
ncbi:MAG: ribosome small subunit-dependent GTPase A [Deltaproteobacteria bacterium]|nr:ribosome small subunit-dependent GTPase A [Deltaproteobacteria bacterium]